MKKKECPSCAMEIDADLDLCPICSYEFPKTSKIPKWIAILFIVLILLYLLR
jgi:hypothetical protein